jgi:hypothetical protein
MWQPEQIMTVELYGNKKVNEVAKWPRSPPPLHHHFTMHAWWQMYEAKLSRSGKKRIDMHHDGWVTCSSVGEMLCWRWVPRRAVFQFIKDKYEHKRWYQRKKKKKKKGKDDGEDKAKTKKKKKKKKKQESSSESESEGE